MQEEVADCIMSPLSLEVFDLETRLTVKKCCLSFMFSGSEVSDQAVITPDCCYGIFAVETSIVRVWELTYCRPSQLFPIHRLDYEDTIAGLGFTPDGQQVISRSETGIQVWSLATGAEISVDEGNYDYEDLLIDRTYAKALYIVPWSVTKWANTPYQ